jgi:hypothetical protein
MVDSKEKHGEKSHVIKITVRHPGILPYLGDNLERRNTPQSQAIVAEVLANVTARFVVTELFRLRQHSEIFDASRIYTEHYKLVTRLLPKLQRILIEDTSGVMAHLVDDYFNGLREFSREYIHNPYIGIVKP